MKTIDRMLACAVRLMAERVGPGQLNRSASKAFRRAMAIPVALTLSVTAVTAAVPKLNASPPKSSAAVEPEAVQALERMSAYLGTLSTFEIKGETTLDLVTAEGQRLQIGGTSHYKVRRPNGFQIDVSSDVMNRRYFFDGKEFTIFSPKLGFYATTAAPPTIRETLDLIREKRGITLPLEDLFRWNDPQSGRAEKLTSGFAVGTATIDGAATDHYAFREGMHDWEIWIQQGSKPLPRKLVIVDRSDPAHPSYEARLTWNVNATLASSDFTFKPGPGAKAIRMASLDNKEK